MASMRRISMAPPRKTWATRVLTCRLPELRSVFDHALTEIGRLHQTGPDRTWAVFAPGPQRCGLVHERQTAPRVSGLSDTPLRYEIRRLAGATNLAPPGRVKRGGSRSARSQRADRAFAPCGRRKASIALSPTIVGASDASKQNVGAARSPTSPMPEELSKARSAGGRGSI